MRTARGFSCVFVLVPVRAMVEGVRMVSEIAGKVFVLPPK